MKRSRRPDSLGRVIERERMISWSFLVDNYRKDLKEVKTYGMASAMLKDDILSALKNLSEDILNEARK